MKKDSIIFEGFEIVTLCLVWYGKQERTEHCNSIIHLGSLGVSAAGNVIVKELMNEFPFPLTVTLAQLFSVWILSIPLLR